MMFIMPMPLGLSAVVLRRDRLNCAFWVAFLPIRGRAIALSLKQIVGLRGLVGSTSLTMLAVTL